MISAVLRVGGAHLDVDDCLRWLPEEKVDAVWRAGEPHPRRGVRAESGFNLLLAEGDDAGRVADEAARAFAAIASRIEELIRAGASAEVDFGLFISEGRDVSIRFEPQIVHAFAQRFVTILVSAYTCSD